MTDRAQAGRIEAQASPGVASSLTQIYRPGPQDIDLEDDQRRVLLVAAHPDDPEFSSAGTVANWVRQGLDVVFALVTSGDKGTPDRAMTGDRLSSQREQEQRAGAARVGG